MEDDYITVLHLFLLNNCSNQKFIFGALSADIRPFGFYQKQRFESYLSSQATEMCSVHSRVTDSVYPEMAYLMVCLSYKDAYHHKAGLEKCLSFMKR